MLQLIISHQMRVTHSWRNTRLYVRKRLYCELLVRCILTSSMMLSYLDTNYNVSGEADHHFNSDKCGNDNNLLKKAKFNYNPDKVGACGQDTKNLF